MIAFSVVIVVLVALMREYSLRVALNTRRGEIWSATLADSVLGSRPVVLRCELRKMRMKEGKAVTRSPPHASEARAFSVDPIVCGTHKFVEADSAFS